MPPLAAQVRQLDLWFLERGSNNSQVPREPLPGIGDRMWFALVTMTTVGYGDRAPVTASGRVVSGLWMLIALVTTSSLTAGLYLAQTPDSALKLVGAHYAPQSDGIAVASELDIVRKLNITLLASQESGELPRIVRAWLGVSSTSSPM